MFTGIITDVGTVSSLDHKGDTRIRLRTGYDTATIDIGASIACSGVCLTVVDKGDDWFAVEASAETLSRTNLGRWREGSRVNLERALKIGEELGGHIVTGHVDAVGRIVAVTPEGDSVRMQIELPANLAGYVAGKGSITVNGVSLTVNEVSDQPQHTVFGINVIPHTQEKTTFCHAEIGERVNLEVDILARYVARMNEIN
ncbi:MAG: riboflavin synthase [Alphaproteobacteria bacterium]|nr:riboflavin synthase [Alphaproteobacteria bacterium]